jgi:hypothetical protein
MAAKLPAALWPTWALRLALPTVDYTYLSTALPCAVLLVNSRLSFDAATTVIGHRDADGHSLSHTLQQLHGDRHWGHIRDALVRLADYLHEHDGPIDYLRRRSLDYEPLLAPATWQRICADLDIRTGGEKRHRLARCHLYALISASPARYAPWFIDDNEFSAPLANFPALLTPALSAAFHHEAHQFLRDNGIDEPLTWNPPEHLLEDLTFPGLDPADLTSRTCIGSCENRYRSARSPNNSARQSTVCGTRWACSPLRSCSAARCLGRRRPSVVLRGRLQRPN